MSGDDRVIEKIENEKKAVILAAGLGIRMMPVNMNVPKGLLLVKGESLIERQIRQLHEAGVKKIYIVVGFMSESFDYLAEEYGVELIYNSDYLEKNNLFSLAKALDHLSNAYIIPCDIWCSENPFIEETEESWYMYGRQNCSVEDKMIGIAYISSKDASVVQDIIHLLISNEKNKDKYWEYAVFEYNKEIFKPKIVDGSQFFEINTYEDLRLLDEESESLKSEILTIVSKRLNVDYEDIINIRVMKKGMTNRSFSFEVRNVKYVMRIPGEGTQFLINRRNEKTVYDAIAGKGLCDEPIYLDPSNGYKITLFLNNVRTCDPNCYEDVKKCMVMLRTFHSMGLKVDNEFDLFYQIDFYETLRKPFDSQYSDYSDVKRRVFSLKEYIEKDDSKKCLCHIDAVPDNFLFYIDNGKEQLQLTDWEYSGMQDPKIDIAMFCIYSMYEREQIDQLINLYYDNKCNDDDRNKIYCFIAACGLLWSNWCEYKSRLGVQFGEYAEKQYEYARKYSIIAEKKIKGEE